MQMVTGDPERPVSIEFRWADETPLQPQPHAPVIEAEPETAKNGPLIVCNGNGAAAK
jgi:hypothetical protein